MAYTAKMEELSEREYLQKNIEKTLSSMFKEKYGEDDSGVYEAITDDYWVEEQDDAGAE